MTTPELREEIAKALKRIHKTLWPGGNYRSCTQPATEREMLREIL